MSKEEFVSLQLHHQQSGRSLKDYLKEINVGYSTYNYWRKKYQPDDTPHGLAPIAFTEPKGYDAITQTFTGDLPCGATLLFPNGLKAHFGSGTENILMEVLQKSLRDHVLP